MNDFTILCSIDLDCQPDDIKTFPSDIWPDSDFAGSSIVATYEYDQKSQKRFGSIVCFNPTRFLERKLQLNSDIENIPPEVSRYEKDMAGVLSCSWIRHSGGYGLMCLTSDLKIAKLGVEFIENLDIDFEYFKHGFSLMNEIQLEVAKTSVGLSLTLYDISGRCISATCSDGHVYVIKDEILTNKWKAHDMEVWTCTFHHQNNNILLTGSDDCHIKIFDIRDHPAKNTENIFRHSAGVTTLQFSPVYPNMLYSGGFDGKLIQFDVRNYKEPLATVETPGSVWYIDFVREKKGHVKQINIAGIHDGIFVYNTEDNGPSSL